jgi:hypothetical protein
MYRFHYIAYKTSSEILDHKEYVFLDIQGTSVLYYKTAELTFIPASIYKVIPLYTVETGIC